MSKNNMMQTIIHLEEQPGGIIPELHLKEGAVAMSVLLRIPNSDNLRNVYQKRAVLKGIRPDGSDLFISLFTQGRYGETGFVQVDLLNYDVRKLAAAAGRYRCTLTILDTKNTVNRNTYMNYDFQTVLPFTVIVHEKARRDGNAL